MLKKVYIAVLTIFIIFGSTNVTNAIISQKDQVRQLNQTAKQLLITVQAKQPAQALKNIEALKGQLLALKYEGLTTIEGIQSLFAAVTRLQQTLLHVKPNFIQWENAAKSVVLAIDVLSHQAQPLWLSYEQKVSKSFHSLMQSAKQQNKVTIYQNWNEFKTVVALITPALEVQAKPNALDQWRAIQRYLQVRMEQTPIDFNGIIRIENEMNKLIRAIFNQDLHALANIVVFQNEHFHTWTYWSISIGAVILTVLTYVGYRKFKYQSLSIRS
ncbi:MAG: hypothetical protein RLZZ267_628 [Bacillota bacterium]|jgi:sporulation protein YpjB